MTAVGSLRTLAAFLRNRLSKVDAERGTEVGWRTQNNIALRYMCKALAGTRAES
jgi:hypothetical protein